MPNPQPAPPTAAQLQQQQQLEAQRREAARTRSKVPTDKELPDGVDELIIGNAAENYRALREAEKKLDAIMMRKRLENHDALQRSHQIHKTMRIWISNTAENQPWQQTTMDNEAFDFGDSSQATYRVKIEGRLLEDDDDVEEKEKENSDPSSTEESQSNKEQKKSSVPQRTRLSHFFKQIVIEFDRNPSLQPDQMAQIEWKKPETRDARNNKVLNLAEDANFDALEFERKSDENINITINLVRDDFPERYRLSPPLADLLDCVEADRAEVLTRMWSYIHFNKLYEDEDMRVARCDPKLRTVFAWPWCGPRRAHRTNRSPAGIPHRPLLLLAPPRATYAPPHAATTHQATLHDTCRRSLPVRSLADNLRHQSPHRGPPARPSPGRAHGHPAACADRGSRPPDRADDTEYAGEQGEARFLRGDEQGSGQLHKEVDQQPEEGFGSHSWRSESRCWWRDGGRAHRGVEEGREGGRLGQRPGEGVGGSVFGEDAEDAAVSGFKRV